MVDINALALNAEPNDYSPHTGENSVFARLNAWAIDIVRGVTRPRLQARAVGLMLRRGLPARRRAHRSVYSHKSKSSGSSDADGAAAHAIYAYKIQGQRFTALALFHAQGEER